MNLTLIAEGELGLEILQRHPVHTGEKKPSYINCRGCEDLRWDDFPPDIQREFGMKGRYLCYGYSDPCPVGWRRCPKTETLMSRSTQAAAHQAILHIIRDVMTAPCDRVCSSCCLWVPSEQRCAINLIHEIMGVTNGGRPEI